LNLKQGNIDPIGPDSRFDCNFPTYKRIVLLKQAQSHRSLL
jgi:hypothetical protein